MPKSEAYASAHIIFSYTTNTTVINSLVYLYLENISIQQTRAILYDFTVRDW